MEFAYFVSSSALDKQEALHETVVNAREQMQFVDEAGFDMIWFPEHHFTRALASPSPLLNAVDAAHRVKRARVGTSVIIPAYTNPLSLAAEIALADHLTDGRLEVGFARGSYLYEYERFGMTQAEAAARTRECVVAVDGLLKQEDFAFEGQYWRFPPTTVIPRPYQQPRPKFWIAARSVESVRFTIENQMGMFVTVQQEPLKRLRAQIGLVDAMVDELEDYPRPKISVSSMTYVTPDRADALATMEWSRKMRVTNWHLHHNTARISGGYTELDPLPEGMLYSPEELSEHLIVGDVEACIEKLKFIESMGVDQFVVYGHFGQPQVQVMRSLERFVTQVMPHFVGSGARQPAATSAS